LSYWPIYFILINI